MNNYIKANEKNTHLLSEGWKKIKFYNYKTGKLVPYDFIEMKVNGEVRNAYTKEKLSINYSNVYPRICARDKGKKIDIPVHIAMISTFGDTKDIEGIPHLQVDHIDRNKLNYKLENLRFVTASQNNLNRGKSKSFNYYVIYDHINLKVKKIYKEKEKSIKSLKKNLNNSFESILICSDNLFDKYQDNLDFLLILLIKSEFKWAKLNENYSVSKDGIVKCSSKNHSNIDRFSLGTSGQTYYRIGSKIPNRSNAVHILIAEVFLNNGKQLEPGLVVDHIDNDKSNNSIDNLRIVTRSGNMNNEITKRKFSKPLKCEYLGKTAYFKSVKYCAEMIGVGGFTVSSWASGKRKNITHPEFSNFQYLTEDEINDPNIKYVETREDLKE